MPSELPSSGQNSGQNSGQRTRERSVKSSRQQRGPSRAVKGALPDDIPVARRSTPAAPKRSLGLKRLGIGAGGALVLLIGLALLFPAPLRRLLGPPPVAGLNVRASLDGRLLGHFPYQEVAASNLVAVAPGIAMQRDAAEAFDTMRQAAAADGVDLVVLSGFRSIALQKHLFFDVKSERYQTASQRAKVSAPPGYSEHATGFAVDVGDGSAPAANLSQSFEHTAAFAWLQANAPHYQFTLSFPKGNTQGVNYEPWHWRYEGSTEALKVFDAALRLNR